MTASHYAPDTLERADTWRGDALCRPDRLRAEKISPDIWYAEKTDLVTRREALSICERCPVRAKCEEDSLAREGKASAKSRYGIRGGRTEWQRYTEYRRRAQRVKDAESAKSA
ncbi:WhiB family transcriptional regulator [Streptomyces syringium]|uniref:WhiB family transcriptional regulator n=1 Tax=Streptomyces syringium TaxID=76729 RepID=UPI0034389DC2